MTVVDPAPSMSYQPVISEQEIANDLPEIVRLLDVRRSDVAAVAERGHIVRPGTSRLSDDSRISAEDLSSGMRLLRSVRAYMVVPVVDFALMLAPLAWRPLQLYSMLTFAIVATLFLSSGGRYIARLHLSLLDELPSIVTRLMAATTLVSAIILHLHQKDNVLVFLETAVQAGLLVIVGRVLTARLIAITRRCAITQHHTVLVGGGEVAAELARVLRDHREYGLKVEGFVDDAEHSPAEKYLPRLGCLADLDMAVLTTCSDTLLLADGKIEERALMEAVRTPLCQTVELLVVPRMPHFHTLTGMADHIGSIPIMRIRNPNLRGPARLIKRGFDILLASSSLLVLSPVLIASAIAVRVEGGPGVIFRQERVGRDGKLFELLKFRSMRPADENESQTQWSVASDNRVGPVGKFLRCTSIDELPQLWNILRGDMTVVGPRPERPHFVEQFSTQFDRYSHRHRVQVGLTGFAQVSGLRGDTSIDDRARHDNFYIENWSLWLDIKIIVRTFREVLFYRGR